MPQNVTEELSTDSLTMWKEFMVHNPANVKQNDKHALGYAPNLTCLLQSWIVWAFPWRRLLFGLWVVAIEPTLVTSDDPQHEVGLS